MLKDIECLFKNNPTPTLILKPGGAFTIAAANDAFVQVVQKQGNELIDKPVFDAFPDLSPDDDSSAIKCLQTALQKVVETKQDLKIGPIRYDLNSERYWKARTSPVVDENGKLQYIIYSVKDITKKYLKKNVRKNQALTCQQKKTVSQLEKSEQNLRAIFENSIEGFVLTDTNLHIRLFNSKAAEYILLKKSSSDFQEGHNLLDYIEEPWREYFRQQIKEVLTGQVVQHERPVMTEEALLYISFSIYPVRDEGKITGICISGRDITPQKTAEDKLEKSEKKYRGLIENSSDGVILISDDATIQFVSPPVEHITGYQPVELLGTSLYNYIKPHHGNELEELLKGVRQTKNSQIKNHLYSFRQKNGNLIWLELTFSNKLDNESLNGIVINFRDVTQRQQAEQELLKLNSRLTSAQKIARLGYWELDLNRQELFWSDEHFSIWGLSNTGAPLSFEAFLETLHPDDRERLAAYHAKTVESGQDTNISYRIITTGGEIRHIHSLGKSLKDAEGKIIRMEGTVQDITERINAKNAILESEEKYRKIFQLSPLPKWIFDVSTLKIVEVNEAAVQHYGYSRDEFLNFSITDLGPGDELIHLQKTIKESGNAHSSGFGRLHHRRKNGQPIILDSTWHRTVLGDRDCIMVTLKDITESIKAEKALLESNERFKLASRATSDAIWDYDLSNDRIYLGDGFHTLFGYDQDVSEVAGEWIAANVHPEDIGRVAKGVEEAIKSGSEFWNDEYRYKKADGEYATVVSVAVIVRDKDGQASRMIGALKDISFRKEEEHHLKLLESVILNTTDSVIITSADASDAKSVNVIYANKAFLDMTGFSAEEVLSKGTRVLLGPETDLREIARLQEAMKKGESCQIQTSFYKKNGERYWGSLAIAPVTDTEGRVKNYIGISRDISNIVNYIHEIEEQNKKLREIAWVQSHLVRAPLSRILGLADLLRMDDSTASIRELLPLLYQSALDLDEVVKDIVKKTEDLK